nr:MAG TPA: hypothetical protein [Caudoviricetes sp.]
MISHSIFSNNSSPRRKLGAFLTNRKPIQAASKRTLESVFQQINRDLDEGIIPRFIIRTSSNRLAL